MPAVAERKVQAPAPDQPDPQIWITIRGKRYPLNTNFSLKDASIIKRYTGLTPMQIDAEGGFADDDPDFLRACLHMVLKRDNPRRSDSAIELFVDGLEHDEVEFDFGEETTPDPTAEPPSRPPETTGGPPTPGFSNGATGIPAPPPVTMTPPVTGGPTSAPSGSPPATSVISPLPS